MEYTVTAHMPGLTARTVVSEGDKVSKGQELMVINVMKMEMSVVAPKSGVIKSVLTEEWDELELGTPVMILEVEE